MEKIIVEQTSNQSSAVNKVLLSSFKFGNMEELLILLNENKDAIFLVLDTETTGLGGHKKQQLTQIAALPFTFNKDKFEPFCLSDNCQPKFEQMISLNAHSIERNKDKTSNTHFVLNKLNHYFENLEILNEQGEEILDEQSALEEFFDWIAFLEVHTKRKVILVAQNATFDMDMIYGRSETEQEEYKYLCTKIVILKALLPNAKVLAEKGNEKAKQYLLDVTKLNKKKEEYYSSSMGLVAPALGIELCNYHDALADCHITMKMFNKILDF